VHVIFKLPAEFGPYLLPLAYVEYLADHHIMSDTFTGGIRKFSAKDNFRKILKVSHVSLGFSLDEKCDKIKTSHRVLPEFSYFYRV